jgi:bifunctional NMN adenylyltransferase/nudix hydrolase
MMTKKYHTLVFVGRFQPVTVAHAEIIRRAMAISKQLVIIVGSANQPRTYKNPWTSKDREMMLSNVVNDIGDTFEHNNTFSPGEFDHTGHNHCMVRIEHNIDTLYNDQSWGTRVQDIVAKYTQPGDNIALIGHKKDDSSAYLDMFPQWGFEEIELIQPLNATNVRDLYFRRDVNMNFLHGVLPPSVSRMLEGWRGTPEYLQVIKEREFVETYQKQYASLPYAPVFVTVDAVIVCSGHVLMVKRRSEPGKHLMALPGGYLNASTDKSMIDAAIRELREETGIKVPAPVLRGSIVQQKVFDAIGRDPRGRVITHAFHIGLPDGPLPKVKGADDALSAKWIPLSEIKGENCYSDHLEIIKMLVGI